MVMTDFHTLRSQSARLDLRLPHLVVQPDWLTRHLEHPALRLLDVRPPESYDAGHIPGSVQLDLVDLTGTINGVEGMLLTPGLFANHLSRLGVGSESAVVIYDDNWGLPAARVLWSLVRYGHHQVAVLNGGWDRWLQQGLPWTTQPFTPARTRFEVRPDDEHVAEYTWLLQQLDRPDLILVDTRAAGEFQEGHLPGAIRWDWINGVPVNSWDIMRPAQELLVELSGIGITPDKEIVTYCHSGVRAAHTYLLLRSLGYSHVRVYDGSWLEWAHYQAGR
jgi:thiosulfate/3-mercaptopyruvate sulfurtransferase